MSDYTQTAIADATGAAVATISLNNSGLVWIVAQISVETVPFRVGCTAVIRRNGIFVAGSPQGSSDTAYGPPAILLRTGDQLTVTWAGLTKGDQGKATAFYAEQPDSATPTANVVV